ncbi:MAG: DUF3837 domain-containing protein [Lachnospiraceae bacterium]|nr:DUF3837 domain-containing protein [Lachnospiraceae bacterium]
MILSIARQSVIIKCNLNSSIMTGNYEFYYAVGLLYKIKGIEIDEVITPLELHEKVLELIKGDASEDTRVQHLIHMLHYYKPTEQFDDQMKELFLMGNREKYMWQELLPDT